MKLRVRRARAAALLSTSCVAGMPGITLAQTSYQWNGGSGTWSTPGNWTPAGVPSVNGDSALITSANGASFTVTYDYAGTAALLNTLTLDDLGGPGSATLSLAQNNVNTQSEFVGQTGSGAVIQKGGEQDISTLSIGNLSGGAGDYVFSAGTLNVSTIEFVGKSGSGEFLQSGGVDSSTGFVTASGGAKLGLDVGSGKGAFGLYTLSAGSLTVAFDESIGEASTGTFVQTGGANLCQSALVVGHESNSSGTYNLSGGTLQVVGLTLGDFSKTKGVFNLSGTGALMATGNEGLSGSVNSNTLTVSQFNQRGGTNAAAALTIGNAGNGVGTYAISSGMLNISGSLTISGVNSLLSVTGGSASFGRAVNGGNVSIGTAGIVTVSGQYVQSAGSTTINGSASVAGGTVINGGSFAIGATGVLDVVNSSLTINYSSSANDPVAAIAGNLTSGYAGGAWTGAGIRSSIAAAGTPGQTLSVGYADGNIDSGTAAQPNQLLVKYTLAGDTNLDGLVNFGDLVAVIQNFNKSGTDWAQGNFGYGASTNFNDLVAVIQNFNKTLTPAGSSGGELGGAAGPIQIHGSAAELPEPAAFSVAAIGAAVLVKRRRNR